MIRIDSPWLCAQPQDMRAGAERLLAVVVNTLGAGGTAGLDDAGQQPLGTGAHVHRRRAQP